VYLDTGVSGNVLINEKGHRLRSYIIWDYAEGHDSYYKSMMVDLTQPPDKVTDFFVLTILMHILIVACSNGFIPVK